MRTSYSAGAATAPSVMLLHHAAEDEGLERGATAHQ